MNNLNAASEATIEQNKRKSSWLSIKGQYAIATLKVLYQDKNFPRSIREKYHFRVDDTGKVIIRPRRSSKKK